MIFSKGYKYFSLGDFEQAVAFSIFVTSNMLIDNDNAKNGENMFSMTTFYMYIYLIINALINTAVKDYSEILLTMGSGRIEASRLAVFCTIRVFSERYCRTVRSSKLLLLLNYFISVSMFQSVIFSDHCPTSLIIVQGGYFLFFKDTR